MSLPEKPVHDGWLASSIAPDQAVQLVQLFRHPGELTFIQSLPERGDVGPTIEVSGPQGPLRRRANASQQVSLNELAQGPFRDVNPHRCGVYWTVNPLAPGATARKAHQVARVAAVFIDLDGSPLPEVFPLPPTAVVETSPGRYHVYWSVTDLPKEEFSRVQQHLSAQFGADPVVNDLPRLMRLPGYWHGKHEERFLSRLVETRVDARYTRADLLRAFPDLQEALAPMPEKPRPVAATPPPSPRCEQSHGGARLDWGVGQVAGAPPGQRNDTLNRVAYTLGGAVANGELDEATVSAALLAAAQQAGLEPTEARRTLHSGLQAGLQRPLAAQETPAASHASPLALALPKFVDPGTDVASAHVLEASGVLARLRYTPGLGWLTYDPRRGVWVQDPGEVRAVHVAGEVLRREVGKALQFAIEQRLDKGKQDLYLRWARRVGDMKGLRSALDAARGLPAFLTPLEAWDAPPHLVNCLNGTLDVRTGTLHPHRPDDLLTWQSGAAYQPDVEHPAVARLLELLRKDGRDEFLHRLLGSALYGEAPNETLTVFQGEGGTGKGTLIAAVLAVLGDYAGVIPVELLLASSRGEASTGPKPELLALRGKRLIVAGEPPKGGRFNAGRVKGMTGNDFITARGLHQDPVTFKPKFKVLLHTNYPVAASHDDSGMQRRMVVVPFQAKPDRPDPDFKRTLEQDPGARSALLNWMVSGCRAWLNDRCDLKTSGAISQATQAYWSEQDTLGAFVDEFLTFDPAGSLPAARLTALFKAWQEERKQPGVTLPNYAELTTYLQDKGVRQQRSKTQRHWQGIREPDPAGDRVTAVTPVTPLTGVSLTGEPNRGGTLDGPVIAVTRVTTDDVTDPAVPVWVSEAL